VGWGGAILLAEVVLVVMMLVFRGRERSWPLSLAYPPHAQTHSNTPNTHPLFRLTVTTFRIVCDVRVAEASAAAVAQVASPSRLQASIQQHGAAVNLGAAAVLALAPVTVLRR
jgi:hypothetical protein